MELMHAEKLRKQELEQAKIDVFRGNILFHPEILSGKLAELLYRDAAQKIKGAEFILSLIQIAAIFDFTKELQDTILQDLQCRYVDDCMMWDFMAKSELDAAGAPELQSAKGRASDTDRREEQTSLNSRKRERSDYFESYRVLMMPSFCKRHSTRTG